MIFAMLKFSMAKYHVIIPAAGSSSRMDQKTPKQFSIINSKTILQTIEAIFSNIKIIDTITIALNHEMNFSEKYEESFSKKTKVLYTGGNSRSETVLNTLSSIQKYVSNDDWVLVHDASRIGINENIVKSFIKEIGDDEVGGIIAVPSSDTVKRVNENNEVIKTENRERLWLAQTPQMFRFENLKKAIEQFKGNPTDESEAIESLGLNPKIFKGSSLNFKITYPEDLIHARKTIEIV